MVYAVSGALLIKTHLSQQPVRFAYRRMFDHGQSKFSRLNNETEIRHFWDVILTVQVDLTITFTKNDQSHIVEI